MKPWNMLSREVVDYSSLEVFKAPERLGLMESVPAHSKGLG